MSDRTIPYYHHNAQRFQSEYDSIQAADVHADWVGLLNARDPGVALDVGAGSGRDAFWLAKQGWQVTAVEPAKGLRELGERTTGEAVTWVGAELPLLEELAIDKHSCDLILLSAVWMHIPVSQRSLALSHLSELLSPEGFLIVTLRFGPSDPERPMYNVSTEEVHHIASRYGLLVDELSSNARADCLQRREVTWKTLCLHRQSGIQQ